MYVSARFSGAHAQITHPPFRCMKTFGEGIDPLHLETTYRFNDPIRVSVVLPWFIHTKNRGQLKSR